MLKIKNFFIIFLMSLILITKAHASELGDMSSFNPYLGVDYRSLYRTIDSYWDISFSNHTELVGVFVGNKFNSWLGLEVGYFKSYGHEPKYGTYFFGLPYIYYKLKLNGFKAMVNLYYAMTPNFLLLSGGITTVHTKTEIEKPNDFNFEEDLVSVEFKNAIIPRAGFGLEYKPKSIGLRLQYFYELSSNAKLNVNSLVNNSINVEEKPYKDSMSFEFGVFYAF